MRAATVEHPLLADAELVPGFDALGLVAFTTARGAGTFGANDPATSAPEFVARWGALAALAAAHGATALASAHQVHGTRTLVHDRPWSGWLRVPDADGHLARARGITMAVTIADCVPVFLAHADGPAGVLHAGWRGTAGGILRQAIGTLAAAGFSPSRLRVHLGPAVSGDAYEVGPDVFHAVTGRAVPRPTCLDLRAVLAEHAAAAGVGSVTISPACTVRDRSRWFSHRAGDSGRQVGVVIVPSP